MSEGQTGTNGISCPGAIGTQSNHGTEGDKGIRWLPCPFCNGFALMHEAWIEVVCQNCGASALPGFWNRRPRELPLDIADRN